MGLTLRLEKALLTLQTPESSLEVANCQLVSLDLLRMTPLESQEVE